MRLISIFKNVFTLFYAITTFYKIPGEGGLNNAETLDNLDDNSVLAFFLLIQLEVPYFLEGLSSKVIYEKVIDATIYLFKEEIIKSGDINEIKHSIVQNINNIIIGLNNILRDIKNNDEKYLIWLELISNDCWNKENGCRIITRRNCSLSVLTMLPKRGLAITCMSCIIYALNYASHSLYLFKNFSNIENCNNENNIKLISLSSEISIIRENIIYLNSLEKISVLKNVQSEIIVIHIKNGSGLIKLLNIEGHGAFIRIVSNSIYEVIKKSINDYIKYVNNNNIYKNNDYTKNLNIDMIKSITLTINGYLYKDNQKNKIFRIFDFGLFLTDIHLNKCISLLNGNNIFIQLEIGSSQTNVPFKNGNILNLIELEIILNSFLHFGYNYYSKVFLMFKKIIYLKNFNDTDVFIYHYNNNIYEDMGKWLRPNLNSAPNKHINLNNNIVNNVIYHPNQNNNNNINLLNNIDETQLTDDQTIYCIIIVNITPENKYLFLKESIINLLNKPIYSRSLSGFQYKDNKIINEELIEILGESYYNSLNKSKRRTKVFGSRINAREIQSVEKLIKPGLKLIHIAFHNFTSIPVEQRNTFYSANNMFSLFQHRIHYLKEWNPKLLIIKKFYPEDMIIKSYNVYSYPKNNNKYWFIISCTVIPFLIIILFILLCKRWFPDNVFLCFPFFSKHRRNHNKQKRKQNYKYSCSTCRKKCFKHMYKMEKDKSQLRKRLILQKKNNNNLLLPQKRKDKHVTRNRQRKSTTALFLEEIQTNDIIE
ncbi:hypothetical protein PGSY75_1029700 [Plasmodium gaboni]|uniref:Uncharacterized protein n=1 Tax=Plasmodium gaboni TaxID=647221 RepID=A0A151LLC3_9APIC|nr:hypothetical protein PGSY75_1029700 [Plasmodium gaboni]KYN99677.1 hypothetical protein PGSY75_1029700 [Plasmodium gaboni]